MDINVNILCEDTKTLLVSKNIFDSLNLIEGTKYKLHFGQNEHPVYIKFDSNSEEEIYISSTIFSALHLIENITLNIWRKDRDIFLGPIIGIAENRKYINAIADGNLHIRAMGYSQESSGINCFTYFFSSSGIDLKNKLVKGYYFNFSKNKWIGSIFPIPDVIYERSNNVKNIFKDFKNIKYINNNNKSLNKGSLYSKLSKYPEMEQYLPDTIVYESFKDVKAMLSKYNHIFLKSFHGASGIEVMSIERINRQYEINYFLKDHKRIAIKNLSELEKIIKEFFYKKEFIIQQGIRLLKYDGHKMDLRILIQRDKCGQWKVTAYLSRLAKEGTPITNNCIGGELVNYDKIYDALVNEINENTLPTKEELGGETINIASYIEKAYGRLGEIGMDIAIDEKGKIWFIEANLGPANTSPPELDEKETSNKYLTLLEYAVFLAGLNKTK